jgi:hypothetical protein
VLAERGKIKLLREAINTAAVVRAVFPEGLSGTTFTGTLN